MGFKLVFNMTNLLSKNTMQVFYYFQTNVSHQRVSSAEH